MKTFEKQLRENFNGGQVTLPAPDKLRGTYEIVRPIEHIEQAGENLIMIRVTMYAPKSMEKHQSRIQYAHIWLGRETGQISQLTARYFASDGRSISYKYRTVTDLRGVSIYLPDIGVVTQRTHHLFNVTPTPSSLKSN